jgi:hypothetical protein
MYHTEQLNELAKALALAQGEIEGAKKGSTNPAFKSKYADLSEVWDACREPLGKHGLSVAQLPAASDDGKLHLKTRLLHTSGQWLESEIVMPLSKQDPQGYGSALTYARRYGLAAMVGIVQEDDDGNAATAQSRPAPQTQYQEPAQSRQSAPQATNTASGGNDVATLKKAWFKAMCQTPGLTEPSPDDPTKQKPAGEWFHLAKRYNLPAKYSTWTAEQARQALEAVANYRADQERRAVEQPRLMDDDAPPAEITDPFA